VWFFNILYVFKIHFKKEVSYRGFLKDKASDKTILWICAIVGIVLIMPYIRDMVDTVAESGLSFENESRTNSSIKLGITPTPTPISTPMPTPESTPTPNIFIVEGATTLRLRERPSTQARILGSYPEGTRVIVLGRSRNWMEVEIAGIRGYMGAAYLSKWRRAD